MYCTVTEKASKRKPESSGIYRNPRAKIVYVKPETAGKVEYEIELDGISEVTREPRQKWTFVLNESKRQDGKVVKKQWNVGTYTYWDFVDEYLHDLAWKDIPFLDSYDKVSGKTGTWFTAENVIAFKVSDHIEKHFPLDDIPDPDINLKGKKYKEAMENVRLKRGEQRGKISDILAIVKPKLLDIKQKVVGEYIKSDEYNNFLACLECIKKPLADIIKEEKEARRAERHQERERKQQKHDDFHEQASFILNTHSSHLSERERALVERIVAIGKRTLSKEFHPDHGGTHEDMIELNLLGEKLKSILGV